MELHQIQVTYQADEDRILCRASFKEENGCLHEVRAWLTRRMVKGLWPTMMEVMEKKVALDKPHVAHATEHVVGMEHHASVEAIRDSGSFSNPYEDDIRDYPLGETPILVTTVNFNLGPNQPIRMNLLPAGGGGFEIAFADQVMHGFSSLLLSAVRNAGWDLNLALPGLDAPVKRVLN